MPTLPTLSREPQTIAAGDAVQWEKHFADYSAATWTLNYLLRNAKNRITFQATANGENFSVSLTSATTAAWLPGVYSVGAYVVSGSSQVQVRPSFPTMEITPNLSANPNGTDPRSWAAVTLASVESTIQKLTSRSIAQASVNGQMYSLANIAELFQLREKLASEVRREQYAERLNAGLGAGNKIGVRFKPLNSGWPQNVRAPWQ